MLDSQIAWRGNRVRPDHQELVEGLKMTAVAVVSALLTATLVIGAGRGLLSQPDAAQAQPAALIRVSTR
jgi:hypothetical protein